MDGEVPFYNDKVDFEYIEFWTAQMVVNGVKELDPPKNAGWTFVFSLSFLIVGMFLCFYCRMSWKYAIYIYEKVPDLIVETRGITEVYP